MTRRGTSRGRRSAVAVDLEVPARELVDALGQPFEADVGAAEDVGAARPHARGGKREHVLVGDRLRHLRDADETGAEPRERVHQVRLVVRLEGSGDDGAAPHIKRGHPRAVVLDREGRRQIALVGDQRKPPVDDVKVGVEDWQLEESDMPPPPALAHARDPADARPAPPARDAARRRRRARARGADVLMRFIGTGAPQLAALIIIAMSLAVLLDGTEPVISEAAISAMLLVMVGPSAGCTSAVPPRPCSGSWGAL